MKKEIPLEEFTVSVKPKGIYQRCRNCGKETRIEMKKGIAELIFCPECGSSMKPQPESEGQESTPFKELRERSGMNKKQFAEYFEIPYRTVQNWEAEVNKCPEYLMKLMQYKLDNENKK